MESINNILENINQTQIIQAVLVFAGCCVIIPLLRKWLHKCLELTGNRISAEIRHTIERIFRVILLVTALLLILNALGIKFTSLVVLLSVLGLAVTLAVQDILNSIAGGLIIFTTRPFAMGDYIQTGDSEGQVTSIQLMHTRIRTSDNKTIVIPNSALHTATLKNFTENGQWLVTIPVSVSYDNSPDDVRAAVMDAVKNVPEICDEPVPKLLLDEYMSNDISYLIQVYTTREDYCKVKYALNEALFIAFQAHDVSFSYPHINVHMK